MSENMPDVELFIACFLFQCSRVAVCTGLTMFSEIEFCPALPNYIKEVRSFSLQSKRSFIPSIHYCKQNNFQNLLLFMTLHLFF